MIAMAIDAKTIISASAARSSLCRRLRCRLVMSEMRGNSDTAWLLRMNRLLALQRIKTLVFDDCLTLGTENPIDQCPGGACWLSRRVPVKLATDRIRTVQHVRHAGFDRSARVLSNAERLDLLGVPDSAIADRQLVLGHGIDHSSRSRKGLIFRRKILIFQNVFFEINVSA